MAQADASGFNKVVRIPTWVVTLIKVSLPAFGVLLAGYVGYKLLVVDVDKLKCDMPVIKQRVETLERTQMQLKMNSENFADKVGDGIQRIEKNVEKMSNQIDKVSTTQQQIQTDVRVIQQRLKSNGP